MDSYRLKQLKNDFIDRYKVRYQSGVNLSSFDFSNISSTEQLEEVLKTSSFFNEHKFIVCKNIFSKKTVAEKIAQLIKDYRLSDSKDSTLAAIEELSEKELVSKNKALFKIFSDKNSTVKVVDKFEGVKLTDWVKNEVETRNCKIKNQSIQNLIDIVGNDTWALTNEIEKLASYKQTGEITTEDIKLLVSSKTDLSIFELIEAISSKNNKKALELLYQELGTGRDPYYILTMVIHQFRNLLVIKDLANRGFAQIEIVKKSGFHPFVVKKIMAQIINYDVVNLKASYSKLLNLEVSSKRGLGNLSDGLYSLVI